MQKLNKDKNAKSYGVSKWLLRLSCLNFFKMANSLFWRKNGSFHFMVLNKLVPVITTFYLNTLYMYAITCSVFAALANAAVALLARHFSFTYSSLFMFSQTLTFVLYLTHFQKFNLNLSDQIKGWKAKDLRLYCVHCTFSIVSN